MVTRALLREGDSVWVEDPCYHMTREGLRDRRTQLVPVPVDAEGLQVARGEALEPAARLAVVTPTHQSPLGVSLSLPRRLALLAWAATQDAWILEDDYDGEFHYAGHPLPALKSLDRSDRVIYAGSFGKVLFPGLRLGYVVAPARLLKRLAASAQQLQSGQSDLAQRVVAALMRDGHFARHLRRMRALYARVGPHWPRRCRARLAKLFRSRCNGAACTCSRGLPAIWRTPNWPRAPRVLAWHQRHYLRSASAAATSRDCCWVSPTSRKNMPHHYRNDWRRRSIRDRHREAAGRSNLVEPACEQRDCLVALLLAMTVIPATE